MSSSVLRYWCPLALWQEPHLNGLPVILLWPLLTAGNPYPILACLDVDFSMVDCQPSLGKGATPSSHVTAEFTAWCPYRIGLRHLEQARPTPLPTTRFLFIGSGFCLLLPSDPSSRRAPWTWLTVPAVRPVGDFHPQESPHARHTPIEQQV